MANTKLPLKKKGIRRKRTEHRERYLSCHEENLIRQRQWREEKKTHKAINQPEESVDETTCDANKEPLLMLAIIRKDGPSTAPITYCADSSAAVTFEENLSVLLEMMEERIKKAYDRITTHDPEVLSTDVWSPDLSDLDGILVQRRTFGSFQEFLDQLLGTGLYDALKPTSDEPPYNIERYPCVFEEFVALPFQSRFILVIIHMLGWHAICAYEKITIEPDFVQEKTRPQLLTVERCFNMYNHLSDAWFGTRLFEYGGFVDYLHMLMSKGWLTLHAIEGEETSPIFVWAGNDRVGGKGGLFVAVYTKEARGSLGKELAYFAELGVSPWDLLCE